MSRLSLNIGWGVRIPKEQGMCLATPGKVEEITIESCVRMGRVNFGGVVKRVCLDAELPPTRYPMGIPHRQLPRLCTP